MKYVYVRFCICADTAKEAEQIVYDIIKPHHDNELMGFDIAYHPTHPVPHYDKNNKDEGEDKMAKWCRDCGYAMVIRTPKRGEVRRHWDCWNYGHSAATISRI